MTKTPYQQVVKTLANDTQGDERLLKIAARDLIENVKTYLANPKTEKQQDEQPHLADSVETRCIDAVRSIDGDGLCDLAELLLGGDDPDIQALRNQVG